MSSIFKGTLTVIVATVIASATILMTGNTVADGNQVDGIPQGAAAVKRSQENGVDGPKAALNVRMGKVLPAGHKTTETLKLAKASSLNELAPPPGPFHIENKNSKGNGLGERMNIAPPQMPSPPSEPVVGADPESPAKPETPKTPDISERNAALQAKSLKNEPPEKMATPIVPEEPKTPELPAIKLTKPAEAMSAPVMPVEVEKSLGSFRPLTPSLDVGQRLSADRPNPPKPKMEKKVLAPGSLVAPELSIPQQVVSPKVLKPMINKQRPVQKNMPMPRGAPPSHPVMQARGKQNNMLNQRIQRSNQELWKRQQAWQERHQAPRVNNNYPGNRFSGERGAFREAPKMPQRPQGMLPPTSMYRNAPPYPAGNPSNYRYPQMPQWGGGRPNFQMRPDNVPKLPGGRPDTNIQGQFQYPAMMQNNTKAPIVDR